MNMLAMILWTWRVWLSRFGHIVGGRDRVNLEAIIKWQWRCTRRPQMMEIDEVLGGGRSGGGRPKGRCDCSWYSNHWLFRNCGNVESWVQQHLLGDELLTGSVRQVNLGWWCTQCMQESGYAACDENCTSAKNISVRAEGLRQSGRAPPELSQTPRWQITTRLVSLACIALHIALQSRFHRFFSLYWSPIWKKHSDVVANCDHTWE